ncbi:hypothetical protein ACJMK2_003841 [Sinanodonta woodiana]|uniref:Uncharacterized protein n=1 Tax=Sinanodonta woodiana TaxID=1069815 RepID=A0ABD3Y1C3_SINWO
MNTTLCMKLFLFMSFLALSEAWIFRRGSFPFEKENITGKGPEQGSPSGPLKVIVGEIDELKHDVAALSGRVDEIEHKLGELALGIEELEGGSANPESAADPSTLGQGDEPSDETGVRALLQKLESRLKEKKSEQKQILSRGTQTQ